MPRRSPLGLDEVATWENLAAAFWRAARGARHKAEARRFAAQLDDELTRLREDILGGRVPDGQWRAFRVFDPKPRRILAPCFCDRVLHHALMAQMGAGARPRPRRRHLRVPRGKGFARGRASRAAAPPRVAVVRQG